MFQTNPGGGNLEVEATPDVCPQCHHAVHPVAKNSTLTGPATDGSSVLEIAFQCARQQCARMFIGRYKRFQFQERSGHAVGPFRLQKVVPVSHKDPEIFPEVLEISPNFADIFCQANVAEEQGLNQICGGYRKALEFLIKDFCISNAPDDSKAIKSKLLGAVIRDHVTDVNIKACSERAAWLGNDETHYLRKWEAKDINDLKTLIELACVWIRSDLLTKKYLEEM